MLEAKSSDGKTWAYMQILVTVDSTAVTVPLCNAQTPTLVSSMATTDKVKEALRRAIPLMPTEIRTQAEAMLTPEALGIIAGTLTIWAGSHFFGVGEIVDVILLIVGFAMLGPGVWTTATELHDFGRTVLSAKSQTDLDGAANHLAKAVITGGITTLMAVLLRGNVRNVRARGGIQAKSGWIQEAGPPPPSEGGLFRKPVIAKDPTLPAGAGETTMFGDITLSSKGSPMEQSLARHHEWVHSILSPWLVPLRELRANLKASGYVKSALLQYLEEALAETYSLLRVRGVAGLIDGIKFPLANGYVTISALKAEGAAIGTIVFGGRTLTVYMFDHPSGVQGSK